MTILSTQELQDLRNDPDCLFVYTYFVPQTNHSWAGKHHHTPIFKGNPEEISHLFRGTKIMVDGRPAIVAFNSGRKNIAIRYIDDGMPGIIPNDQVVTPYEHSSLYRDWGLPWIGEFVRVIAGTESGKVGVVVKPGTNSTHVVFSGEDDLVRISAKNLQIVKAHIVTD